MTATLGANHPFDRFARQGTVLLTTFRRDGRPVGTPVSLAVIGDHAVFRTYDRAWKTRRLAHTRQVTIAPSTTRGTPTGPAIGATARILDGEEARAAAAALRRKHPVLHGVLVPLAHRLRGYTTLHYRVDPADADGVARAASDRLPAGG
jgi:PPOX class probable F420-dependent enzyme